VGAALTGALRAGAFFAAAGFFVIVALFFAAAFTGLARCAAGFAVERARKAFAAGFFEVFLAAGFFTGTPCQVATLVRKAGREGQGAANFGRRGL
jgi:hypothetical protein